MVVAPPTEMHVARAGARNLDLRLAGEIMSEETHPNLALMRNLNLQDLDACKSIIADDFVWHYFNLHLPELNGDHCGLEGFKNFFVKLGERSKASFQQKLVNAWVAGDELVVVHVCNNMNLDSDSFEIDAVVVWRIVNNKLVEGWDIPAVNTIRPIRNN